MSSSGGDVWADEEVAAACDAIRAGVLPLEVRRAFLLSGDALAASQVAQVVQALAEAPLSAEAAELSWLAGRLRSPVDAMADPVALAAAVRRARVPEIRRTLADLLIQVNTPDAVDVWLDATADDAPLPPPIPLSTHPDRFAPRIAAAAERDATRAALHVVRATGWGLDLARMAPALRPHAPEIARALADGVRAAHAPRARLGRWIGAPSDAEYDVEALCQLALALPMPAATLRRVTGRGRPHAVAALLAQGAAVPQRVIDALARAPVTRGPLFRALDAVGEVRRYPERWRTWAAFAEGSLAEWLADHAELGRPPSRLQVAVRAPLDDGSAIYLLRYRLWWGPWRAGVSGPHDETGEPRPTHGLYTFSAFRRWRERTRDGHLDEMVGAVGALVERTRTG